MPHGLAIYAWMSGIAAGIEANLERFIFFAYLDL
jgi:hypothetical protein